jgi:bifunctional DNase/RNase
MASVKRVDMAGLALEHQTGAPIVVLREHDAPHRLLPIFVGGVEASSIALAATGQTAPRPMSHDVMAALVDGLDGRLDTVEVTDITDGVYHARLNVSGPSGDCSIDSRPSDAIALAVRLGAPLFVDESVLDVAGSLPEPEEPVDESPEAELDEEAIDEAVASFRTFLDDIAPSDFGAAAIEPGDDTSAEAGGRPDDEPVEPGEATDEASDGDRGSDD